jgi:hypothetical protein
VVFHNALRNQIGKRYGLSIKADSAMGTDEQGIAAFRLHGRLKEASTNAKLMNGKIPKTA